MKGRKEDMGNVVVSSRERENFLKVRENFLKVIDGHMVKSRRGP